MCFAMGGCKTKKKKVVVIKRPSNNVSDNVSSDDNNDDIVQDAYISDRELADIHMIISQPLIQFCMQNGYLAVSHKTLKLMKIRFMITTTIMNIIVQHHRIMIKNNMRFDLVSLDCTEGAYEELNYHAHMCLGRNVICRDRMFKEKLIDENTSVILNHFSHNGLHANYDEFEPIAAEKGFLTSYDGMEINF